MSFTFLDRSVWDIRIERHGKRGEDMLCPVTGRWGGSIDHTWAVYTCLHCYCINKRLDPSCLSPANMIFSHWHGHSYSTLWDHVIPDVLCILMRSPILSWLQILKRSCIEILAAEPSSICAGGKWNLWNLWANPINLFLPALSPHYRTDTDHKLTPRVLRV